MRSLCMSLDEARRLGTVVSLALVLSSTGCVDPSAAQPVNAQRPSGAPSAASTSTPTATRRSNVATPFVTLSPRAAELLPGATVLLTATPGGGEAMLFSVDWHVQEGAAGGTVEGDARRREDGTYTATYTAPAQGTGPFHVTASLREYPAASAVATLTVLRR